MRSVLSKGITKSTTFLCVQLMVLIIVQLVLCNVLHVTFPPQTSGNDRLGDSGLTVEHHPRHFRERKLIENSTKRFGFVTSYTSSPDATRIIIDLDKSKGKRGEVVGANGKGLRSWGEMRVNALNGKLVSEIGKLRVSIVGCHRI